MLLALVMVVGMVPVNALAAETEEPAEAVTEAAETTAAVQSEAEAAEPAETETAQTEAAETEAKETEAVETEPAQTEAVESEKPVEASEEAMEADTSITSVADLQAALVAAAAEGETTYYSASSLTLTVTGSETLIVPSGMAATTYADFIVEEGASLTLYGEMIVDDVTVYGTLVNNGNVTMRRTGTTLTVDGTMTNHGSWIFQGVTNTFADGEQIIVNGTLDNYGTLQVGYTKWPANLVEGEMLVYGTLNNYGQMNVISYGDVYVSGTMNVLKNADSATNGAVALTGGLTVESGGTLYVEGEEDNGGITGNGSLYLNGELVMGMDMTLNYLNATGGTLTVPTGRSLTVGSMYLIGSTITVEEGATLIASPQLGDGSVMNMYGYMNLSPSGDLLLDGMDLYGEGTVANIYGTAICQCGDTNIGEGSTLNVFAGGKMLHQPPNNYTYPRMSTYGNVNVYKGGTLELYVQTTVGATASVTVEDYANDVILNGSNANPAYFQARYGAQFVGVDHADISMLVDCYTQEEVEDALAYLEAGKYRAGSTAYAYCDLTGDGMTVPEDVRLAVDDYRPEDANDDVHSTLTVNKGSTMTVKGTLSVGSGYECSCTLNVLGTLVIAASGTLSNNATVYVNGLIENKGFISNSTSYGTLQINDGGVLRDGGRYWGAEPIVAEGGQWVEDKPMTQEEFEELLETEVDNGYPVLDREMTLTDSVKVGIILEVRGGTLTVPSGVTLTVEAGAVLRFADGGKLEVQKGGKLVNEGSIEITSIDAETYICVDGTYSGNIIDVRADAQEGIAKVTGIPKSKQMLSYMYADQADVEDAAAVGSEYNIIWMASSGFTVEGDMTIPENVVLDCFPEVQNEEPVASGILTVPKGSTLTINGTLLFSESWGFTGGLVNYGTILLNKNGNLNNHGSYSGNLPVMNGGSLQSWVEINSFSIREENVTVSQRYSQITLTVDAVVTGENYVDVRPAITWSSSNRNVIDAAQIVDNGDGTYTVPLKADGTAKLTATTDYGTKVTDTVTVTVTPVRPTELILTNSLRDQEQSLDVSMGKAYANTVFHIYLEARDEIGTISLTAEDVKWTSSDKTVASIDVQEDGSAKVTVWEEQHGVVYLTATAYGISETLKLTVKDYSPRLGENKVTLDAASGETVYVPLASSFDNQIIWAEFDEDVSFLEAEYNQELESLAIRVRGDLAEMPEDGTYETTLNITTNREMVLGMYEEAFTVTVKSKLPSVKIKQYSKTDWDVLDWFDLYLSSKAGAITKVEVVSEDFQMESFEEQKSETGKGEQQLRLRYTQDYIDRAVDAVRSGSPLKPDTKITLKVYVEGYAYPVEQDFEIKTTTSKINLQANPTTSYINTALGSNIVSFYIREKGYDGPIDLEALEIRFEEEPADWWIENNKLYIEYDSAEKRTETIYVRMSHWLQYVKVTHKVAVTSKLPSIKLGSSTITLNKPVEYYARTSMTLDQSNGQLGGFKIESTAKPGTEAWEEAQKIHLSYSTYGWLYVELKEGAELPASGTYTFKITPYDRNLVDWKSTTVKVKIADLKPKYKLSASTVKLNTALAGTETAVISLTAANDAARNSYLLGFAGLDAYQNDVELRYDGYELTAKLKTKKTGKYVYSLHPIVEDDLGNAMCLSNVTVKLTVQAHSGKISVSQSAKGKLDSLNLESEILYTITKVSNAVGTIDKVVLTGADADLFQVTAEPGVDAKGRQTFALRLRSDVPEPYSTKKTYQVRFRYILDNGGVVESNNIKVKVTQGKLKTTAAKVTYYQSQGALLAKLSLTGPENVKLTGDSIKLNKTKTSKELLNAMNAAETAEPVVFVGQEGMSVWISAAIQDSGVLTVGKTYKLVLEVTPVGMTQEGKSTQVTISVKIAK